MTTETLLAVMLMSAFGFSAYTSASAGIVNITPSKDNTLYEYDPAEGDHGNGAGFHFFAGENGQGELRRGVLAFDVAGTIPAGSTITAVSLSLNMSMTPAGAETIELHKLLADWGEGTSHAPMGEGDGAPATPNDATWRHRFYDTVFWTMQGGDFSAIVSASQSVDGIGHYTWSSMQMVADVQSWLNNPASNFGWLVLGDETASATAKRFDTRESASPPVLTIEYTRVNPSPFFTGEIPLQNGVYYLQFPNGTPFGYYSYLTDPRFIYHFDMGYEYWFDANDGHSGIFFYDFASTHFFYTSPSFGFPYLYDFSLNTVLYYYPDPNNPGHYTTNPRYFYNFATGQIITM